MDIEELKKIFVEVDDFDDVYIDDSLGYLQVHNIVKVKRREE